MDSDGPHPPEPELDLLERGKEPERGKLGLDTRDGVREVRPLRVDRFRAVEAAHRSDPDPGDRVDTAKGLGEAPPGIPEVSPEPDPRALLLHPGHFRLALLDVGILPRAPVGTALGSDPAVGFRGHEEPGRRLGSGSALLAARPAAPRVAVAPAAAS